jgi:hypothetical protein
VAGRIRALWTLKQAAGRAGRVTSSPVVLARRPRDRRPLVHALTVVCLGLAPIVFTAAVLVASHGRPAYGLELRGNLTEPGQRILDGGSPYDPAYLEGSRAVHAAGGEPNCCLQALYPAPVHVAASPLALLPFDVAMAAMAAASIAALIAALLLLGVRDWRCYGVTFLSPVVVQGIKLGSLTPLLVLACAAAWRWRDHPAAAGAASAGATVAKLFLWPLGAWLLITRRFRAAAYAAALAVAVTLGGWAAIGFADLTRYPAMLSDLAAVEQESGYSTVAAGMAAGLSSTEARVLAVVLGAVLLAAAARLDERRSFSLVVVAALVLTPLVWQSYFTFLVVPIALVAPRLSPVWALPLVFWLLPAEGSGAAHIALGQAALAATAAVVLLHPQPALRRAVGRSAQEVGPRGHPTSAPEAGR